MRGEFPEAAVVWVSGTGSFGAKNTPQDNRAVEGVDIPVLVWVECLSG